MESLERTQDQTAIKILRNTQYQGLVLCSKVDTNQTNTGKSNVILTRLEYKACVPGAEACFSCSGYGNC
jgi:hypothetical protein